MSYSIRKTILRERFGSQRAYETFIRKQGFFENKTDFEYENKTDFEYENKTDFEYENSEDIKKIIQKRERDEIFHRYDRSNDYEKIRLNGIGIWHSPDSKSRRQSITNRWLDLLGANQRKEQNIGQYKKFKKIARTQDNNLHLQTLKQIDADMTRSPYQRCTSHLLIHLFPRSCGTIDEDAKLKALRFVFQVLSAYATYDKASKGMHQLVEWFYFHLEDEGENSEEEAFWFLNSLMAGQNHNMRRFYTGISTEETTGSYYDYIWNIMVCHDDHVANVNDLTRWVLKNKLPDLYHHLVSNGCMDYIFCNFIYSWTRKIYINELPYPLVSMFWDEYLLYGDEILIAMMYCIFSLHQEEIKNMLNSHDIILYFSSLHKDFRFNVVDTRARLHECAVELNEIPSIEKQKNKKTGWLPFSDSQQLSEENNNFHNSFYKIFGKNEYQIL